MRRAVLRFAALVVVAAIALAVALVTAPGRTDLMLHVFGLAVAGGALAVLLLALREAVPLRPSALERALEPRAPERTRLPGLDRLDRELALGSATEFDLHFRLRPVLREIAAPLLAARSGVDLDRDAERARHVLGDEAWDVLRADREPPYDRTARVEDDGPVRATIDVVERLA